MRFKSTHSSLEQQAIHLLSAILTLNEGSVTMHSHAAMRAVASSCNCWLTPLRNVNTGEGSSMAEAGGCAAGLGRHRVPWAAAGSSVCFQVWRQ
jgi:hypothetical protein